MRIPLDILEAIEVLAEKRGISKHQWIREALAEKVEREGNGAPLVPQSEQSER